MELVAHIWNIIKEHDLFQAGQIIIVGLSGGPDSVALVNILHQINQRYKTNWRLVVAHLNHKIRGRKSNQDERFCKETAKQLGLSIYVTSKKIPQLSKKRKQSLEETARQERYHFFERLGAKVLKKHKRKTVSIAVGHNLDDNAETVLFRIIRGTGLKGLRGIRLKRKLFTGSHFYLVRPLLFIERREILSYLKTHKITYRIDATNKDRKMLRNRIRHELLPLLKKYNPAILQHLVQLSEMAETHYDYLDHSIKTKFPKKLLSLRVSRLRKEHPAIQAEVINRVLENIKGITKLLTYRHYRALLKLIDTLQMNNEIHLPDKTIARREKDKLIIKRL